MADVLSAAPQSAAGLRPRDRLARAVLVREVAWAVATGVVACLCAVACIELTRATSVIAAIWIAHAVALVGWLTARRSRRADALHFGATVLAFLSANLIVGNAPGHVVLFTACNVIEVLSALLLVRWLCPAGPSLQTLGELTRFIVSVAVAAPMISAAGVGAYFAATERPFVDPALTWWFGHAVGFAAFAPFLLTVRGHSARALFAPNRAAETFALLGLVGMICLFAFSQSGRGIGFLVYPGLILVAVRLRLFGAAAATLIVAVSAIGAAVIDVQSGALIGEAAADAVRRAQLYVGFAGLPAMAVAVILDERDRYAASAAVKQAQAEAASQGKSKLLANVSHEVRTPLNAIIGFGDILLGQRLGPLNPSQDDLLRTMIRSAEQLNALAQDLIDVAKAEAGKLTVSPVRMDLRAVADDVVQRLQPKAAEHGASLRIEGEGALEAIGDPMRVAQILTNLGANAIKYAGRHGPVSVRLYRVAEDRLRAEVEDQGPGIPAERRGELFEPFNRLGKESGQIEGTGIGLAISRRLAELQDGRLDYESAPGAPTRFWLELPAAPADPAAA